MKPALLALLLLFSVSAKAEEACAYPSKKDDDSLSYFKDCGRITGDAIKLRKKHRNNLVYDDKGLACIMFSSRDVFYLHKNGRSQRVQFFDNGCDYFRQGYARGIVYKRMVFIDSQLRVVLNPGFELLTPFDYGHAVVCNGPFTEEKHGEHTFRNGGKCGLINKQGKLVLAASHKIEDGRVFEDYLNRNSHCPAPPLTSASAALCHAKRHVYNMDHYTAAWAKHDIARQGDIWVITFTEEGNPDQEFSVSVDANTAQWQSLIPKSQQ